MPGRWGISCLTILTLCLCAGMAKAETADTTASSDDRTAGQTGVGDKLDISGFFDVVGSYRDDAADETNFDLNQAEIDLETELARTAWAAVAVAYNSDNGVFELGSAEIGLRLAERKHGLWQTLDFVAGQFDVPFGIDYHVYTSPDRKLITAPLAVALTHGGWNDFGARVQASGNSVTAVGYVVNGFESSAEVTRRVLNLSTGLFEDSTYEVNTTPAYAFGARLGVLPLSNLEIGASFALGLNKSDKTEMQLGGVDVQWTAGPFATRGEYIRHSYNRSVAKERSHGLYLQSTYTRNALSLTARYGSFEPHGGEWTDRWTAGLGYEIAPAVEVRLETSFIEGDGHEQDLLQLVASF